MSSRSTHPVLFLMAVIPGPLCSCLPPGSRSRRIITATAADACIILSKQVLVVICLAFASSIDCRIEVGIL